MTYLQFREQWHRGGFRVRKKMDSSLKNADFSNK